jgi:hypothetical protein
LASHAHSCACSAGPGAGCCSAAVAAACAPRNVVRNAGTNAAGTGTRRPVAGACETGRSIGGLGVLASTCGVLASSQPITH